MRAQVPQHAFVAALQRSSIPSSAPPRHVQRIILPIGTSHTHLSLPTDAYGKNVIVEVKVKSEKRMKGREEGRLEVRVDNVVQLKKNSYYDVQ